MNKAWLLILLILLALVIMLLIWPFVFGVPKTEAPTQAPAQSFRGPTGQPFMKGPIGPPPSY